MLVEMDHDYKGRSLIVTNFGVQDAKTFKLDPLNCFILTAYLKLICSSNQFSQMEH